MEFDHIAVSFPNGSLVSQRDSLRRTGKRSVPRGVYVPPNSSTTSVMSSDCGAPSVNSVTAS
jgi:hypothetical protein